MSSSPTKKQPPIRKLPSNITVSTAFLAPIDAMVKDLFIGIFFDYLNRFKVKCTKEKTHIAICGIEGGTERDARQLGITIATDDRLLIQVRDPSLEDTDEELNHMYVTVKFIEVLCHELVHAMQHLTSRSPQSIGLSMRYDKRSDEEAYFFDPFEMEARVLESFYASTFGGELELASIIGT